MATNDKNEGPIVGQLVLYQISSTHVILPAIINGVNADGTVNVCQMPAPGSVTWIDRANVKAAGTGSLDGSSSTYDNRWAYMLFF